MTGLPQRRGYHIHEYRLNVSSDRRIVDETYSWDLPIRVGPIDDRDLTEHIKELRSALWGLVGYVVQREQEYGYSSDMPLEARITLEVIGTFGDDMSLKRLGIVFGTGASTGPHDNEITIPW